MTDLADALDQHDPCIVVLAGPNGAGKSSFHELYLSSCGLPFVNADLIARTLEPDATVTYAYAAAAAAQQVRAALVAQGASFCMETVFSDPAGDKVAFLQEARAAGYTVVLVGIGLDSPELCSCRVSQRVAQGGHDVPDEKIWARYPRAVANLGAALEFVDHAYLFDNSSCDAPYRPLATYHDAKVVWRCAELPDWARGLPGLAVGRTRPRRSASGARKRKTGAEKH